MNLQSLPIRRYATLLLAAVPAGALVWWLYRRSQNEELATTLENDLDKVYLLSSNEYLLDIYQANSDRPFSCAAVVQNKGAKKGLVGEMIHIGGDYVACFIDQSLENKNSVLEIWNLSSDALASSVELPPYITSKTLRFMVDVGDNMIMLWCNGGAKASDRAFTIDWKKKRLRYDVALTHPRPECKDVNQVIVFGEIQKYIMMGVNHTVQVHSLPITSQTRSENALRTFDISNPHAPLDYPKTLESLPNGKFAVNAEQGIKIIEFATKNIERAIKFTPNPGYIRLLSTNVMVTRKVNDLAFDVWDIDEEKLIKQVQDVNIPVLVRAGRNLLLHGQHNHLAILNVDTGEDTRLDKSGDDLVERGAVYTTDEKLIVRAEQVSTKQPLIKVWINE
jgi:hypothetical protein